MITYSFNFINLLLYKLSIMGKIFVEGIKIYAYHGCFKEETAIGTNFQVDVEQVIVKVDNQKIVTSQNLVH